MEKESKITPKNLLPMQGDRDEIDIVLENFERCAKVYNWQEGNFVKYLLPTLNAKAQAVHARMNIERCNIYEIWKHC